MAMSVKKHIPNTVTCMNLACGVLGIVFTFSGRFDWGFYFMLGGALFDFCDGLLARALHVSSPIGKELDSLSDCVTFGLLPSLMLFRYMSFSRGLDAWCWIPLLLAVFSALRLAKFNVDARQSTDFIGLATPACALLCASLIHFIHLTPGSFLAAWAAGRIFLPLLSVILCALLVSEIPMFSFKFRRDLPKSAVRIRVIYLAVVVLCAAAVAALRLKFSMIAVLAVVIYIILNFLLFILPSSRQ